MTRRVVAALNDARRARFVSDEDVELTRLDHWPAGSGIAKLWGSNGRPVVPNSGSTFEYDSEFPPPDGFRLKMLQLWPEQDFVPPPDPAAAMAMMGEKFPGFFDHAESGEGGMHATDTVDFGVVLTGSVWLELDDGEERHLEPGDVFILNGVRHAWHNRDDEICTMLAASIGAKGVPELREG